MSQEDAISNGDFATSPLDLALELADLLERDIVLQRDRESHIRVTARANAARELALKLAAQ